MRAAAVAVRSPAVRGGCSRSCSWRTAAGDDGRWRGALLQAAGATRVSDTSPASVHGDRGRPLACDSEAERDAGGPGAVEGAVHARAELHLLAALPLLVLAEAVGADAEQ